MAHVSASALHWAAANARADVQDSALDPSLLESNMNASLLYRVAAVCLLLFAVAHTVGFQQSDPSWGIDALHGSMRSIHFDAQGFDRTYWDFFLGAGLTVGVLYLFSAILAWQLSTVPAATWRRCVCSSGRSRCASLA
jgi:hypothetical protein